MSSKGGFSRKRGSQDGEGKVMDDKMWAPKVDSAGKGSQNSIVEWFIELVVVGTCASS